MNEYDIDPQSVYEQEKHDVIRHLYHKAKRVCDESIMRVDDVYGDYIVENADVADLKEAVGRLAHFFGW